MKSHEKLLVAIIIIAFVGAIAWLTLGKKNQNNIANNNPIGTTETSKTATAQIENNENSKMVNDNVKLNTSEKLQQAKTFQGLEISDVQITSKDNVTIMLATVTNKTNQIAGDCAVRLTMKDKDGNTITEAHGYISKVEPGKTTQLNISKTFDFANAYDYTIEAE